MEMETPNPLLLDLLPPSYPASSTTTTHSSTLDPQPWFSAPPLTWRALHALSLSRLCPSPTGPELQELRNRVRGGGLDLVVDGVVVVVVAKGEGEGQGQGQGQRMEEERDREEE